MVASARLSSSLPLGARNSAMALLSSGVPHSRSSCATPRSYSSSRIPHGQSGAQRVRAIELGDAGWRELLETHHALVRRQLARFRGREIDTAGDGFFASFDGPARAIRCACSIADGVRELGLDVRAGLHAGECELVDGKVGGIAVHIGARVAANAQAGEVVVSGTVKDLVAGSGIPFEDRGAVELKGIPGEWRLFSVAQPL